MVCIFFYACSTVIVIFESVRPLTPGDESVVYGIVLQRGGDIVNVIGTAFAISDVLAISAWHNFTDTGYLPTDVVILCNEVKAGVILRSSPVAIVLDYDVNDDWVTLQLDSAVFPSHVTLCPEAELPPERDVAGQSRIVGVRDFPAGLIDSSGHLTVGSMNGKIWNYSAPFAPHPTKRLRLEDQFPSENECMVNVRGGRVLGSCGAPYFAENGKVFAFHTGSINDADSEDAMTSRGHSHTSYSEGRVLARLRSFTAKYAHLF